MTTKSNLSKSIFLTRYLVKYSIPAARRQTKLPLFLRNQLSVLVSALLLLGISSHALADPGLLFASLAGDKKIVSYRQDSETGKLTKIAELAIGAEPGYLSANKNGTRLFAAYRSSGELASYQIDSTTGRLIPQQRIQTGSRPWAVISIAPTAQ